MTKYVKIILGLNIGFFILLLILNLKGLNLNGIMALYPIDNKYFHWYQFITYMFAHANLGHLIINMIILVFLGPKLEEKIGSDNFLNFYLFSGIIGGLCHIFLYNIPVIGASAAIWGVLATFAIVYPKENLYLYFILPVKSIILVSILFFIEVISIFTSDGISHIGHVTGALSGVFFYLFISKNIKN